MAVGLGLRRRVEKRSERARAKTCVLRMCALPVRVCVLGTRSCASSEWGGGPE